MADPVVVSARRTATGRFGGTLQDVTAAELGGKVLAAALEECQVEAREVDEVLMGMVYQGGAGANPARQAAIAAGLPYEVPSMTVNKLCGSGLKAIALAAQALRAGEAEVVLAGGMENMSQAPYVLHGGRWGQRLGHGQVEDMLLLDGLWDCFYDCHMGLRPRTWLKNTGLPAPNRTNSPRGVKSGGPVPRSRRHLKVRSCPYPSRKKAGRPSLQQMNIRALGLPSSS